MGKSDRAGIQPGDLAEAIGLLTRVPVTSDGARGAAAAWAWPVAGALVGFLAACGAGIALWLGLSSWVASGVALAILVIATGALHEDGLADCVDGFWGGYDRTTRLTIMADSRIGAYGVIVLVLSLIFRWSLIHAALSAGFLFGPLIAAAALSRVPMVALMCWLPPAREGGLAASLGRPDTDTLILAAAAGLLAAVLVTGFIALPAALIALALCWPVSNIALIKIGGQTGDVLGASQQVTEIGILMVFAAIIA